MTRTKPTQPGGRVRVMVNALHAKSGGGVTYLRNILPKLAANSGLEIILLIHRDQRGLFESHSGVAEIKEVNFYSGFLRLMLWEQIYLPVLARRLGVEVTFSPANFGPLFAPGGVILLRNALAVGKGDQRFVKKIYWRALGLMTALSVFRAHEVMAVSDYARKALTKGLTAGQRRRVSVVYHGCDPAFSPDRGRHRGNFLLAVGDIYIQKNYHTLIKAFATLAKRHQGITLTIAGEILDRNYFNHLESLAAQHRITGKIRFSGKLSQDALIDLYRSCAVFVFPSTAETFGQPLVEAMASGAPIASSNTTAMPEIAGDAAVWFDPEDANELTSCIDRLMTDSTLRAEIAERAQIRAQQFSWDIAAQKTARILVRAARRSP